MVLPSPEKSYLFYSFMLSQAPLLLSASAEMTVGKSHFTKLSDFITSLHLYASIPSNTKKARAII